MVTTFTELAKRYARVSVQSNDEPPTMHGQLVLDGENSRCILSSDSPIGKEKDNSGWFDLVLKTSATESVLLHHAFDVEDVPDPFDQFKQTYVIVPNLIIFNSERLGGGGCKVSEIQFRQQSLRAFFWYQTLERYTVPETLRDKTREFVGELLAHRAGRVSPARIVGNRIDSPAEVYVAHDAGCPIGFDVAGRTYGMGFVAQRA